MYVWSWPGIDAIGHIMLFFCIYPKLLVISSEAFHLRGREGGREGGRAGERVGTREREEREREREQERERERERGRK